jgi:hypothetical protein
MIPSPTSMAWRSVSSNQLWTHWRQPVHGVSRAMQQLGEFLGFEDVPFVAWHRMLHHWMRHTPLGLGVCAPNARQTTPLPSGSERFLAAALWLVHVVRRILMRRQRVLSSLYP